MRNDNTDSRRYREMLGAYLLGGLTGEERDELERHLATCPECRREKAELRETASVLNENREHFTTVDDAPPPDLEDRVVEQVLGSHGAGYGGARAGSARRSTVRRGIGYALPAAALLIVVLVGVVALFPSLGGEGTSPGLGEVEEISFAEAPRGVSTEGAVVAHTWGTEVMMEVTGLRDGEVYTVFVENRDGSYVRSGTFIGVGENEMECELNAAVLRQNADAIVVRDSDGREILRSELERRTADFYV